MKLGVGIRFFAGIFAFPSGKENSSTDHPAASSFGLEIGQQAPAFAWPDQFGHEQSNETLKGSKGTVLLFLPLC
jgi:hypothetical protein